jgi:hypothetical protein
VQFGRLSFLKRASKPPHRMLSGSQMSVPAVLRREDVLLEHFESQRVSYRQGYVKASVAKENTSIDLAKYKWKL